jgi:hypothetical protein
MRSSAYKFRKKRRGWMTPVRQRRKAGRLGRRRFGYLRLQALLRRKGHLIDHKKLFQLYRDQSH